MPDEAHTTIKKTTMKKIISTIAIVLVLALTIGACGNKAENTFDVREETRDATENTEALLLDICWMMKLEFIEKLSDPEFEEIVEENLPEGLELDGFCELDRN